MRNSKIDNVINLTASERYDYFIRKVADFEEVWGLKDAEGWALMGSEDKYCFQYGVKRNLLNCVNGIIISQLQFLLMTSWKNCCLS